MSEAWGEQKWKGFILSWCEHCHVAIITCPTCKNASCTGGGCDKCHDAFSEFLKEKTGVECYLSKEEQRTYRKGLKIKDRILESLGKDETEINWKKLQEEGEMSDNDKDLFDKELES